MELRDYQNELISKIKASFRAGNRHIVAVLGCGGGKSVIQGTIAANANRKGNRVLFLVHRLELVQQITETFRQCGITELTEIRMVQSTYRHVDELRTPDIIITDEAHHSTAPMYRKIYDAFPDAILLGFTATPIRLNRGGLGEVYSDLVTSVSTRWLIDNSYLSDYRCYSVPLADTSKLHVRAGEFKADEVAALMDSKTIYGETVRQWERLAPGKKTIVYTASVETAHKTAGEFMQAGYSAAALDGNTKADVRAETVEKFRRGEVTILCNCELFGEGFDVPDCECAVLLRPTMSLTLYIQQSMRCMRYKPGKTAIIIDHVGNAYRHGLPDDTREWSLEPKKKQESIVKIRECKYCFAVFSPRLDKCPCCGHEVTHEIRTDSRKTVDVDLVELKRREQLKNTRLSDAILETWNEVREFQQLHKYQFHWCLHYCLSNNIAIPQRYYPMMKKVGLI